MISFVFGLSSLLSHPPQHFALLVFCAICDIRGHISESGCRSTTAGK